MDNQQTVQSEVTRHICQAFNVQVKDLQGSLPEILQQCSRALEDNNPEQAQIAWKQFANHVQAISRLFNQTATVMGQTTRTSRQFSPYGGNGQYGRSNRQGRRQSQYTSSGRGSSFRLPDDPRQLNEIINEASHRLVAAAG